MTSKSMPPAPRTINGVNAVGLFSMVKREFYRFATIYVQTLLAPMITTLLFYAVFALAFGGLSREMSGVPFLHFLAPGLIMMTMVQNAFANTSSSLVISKMQGNIVDTLMPPLSNVELLIGWVSGGVLRGLMVGLVAGVGMAIFTPLQIENIGLVLLFSLLGTFMLSSLGLAAGIWSDKFDHISAVTNFIVTPLAFLSGTFYSINVLPGMWRGIALYNPFFYMIDGFRAGFIGQADSNLLIGAIMLLIINIGLAMLILLMLRTGYKIKS